MRRFKGAGVAYSLILIMILGLSGMTFAAEAKDVLTVGLGVEPTSLDPQKTADLVTAMVQRQVYNYLFTYDKNMNLVPELAQSYKLSPDKKTWTITLRKGIKFHNGENFTAASVKYTFDRLFDPATKAFRAATFRMIKSVRVIDDYTVALTTDEPFMPMIRQLTYYPVAILNQTAVKKYGEDYGRHPVGTGPFKFIEWTSGDKIVLERNDQYWEAKPKLKSIVMRFIREDAARTMLLETGEADFITQVPPREAQRLKGNKEVEPVLVDTHYTTYINIVNCQEPPFNNVKVRKALNYAINKKALVDSVLLGSAKIYDSPLSPVGWGYHKTGMYEYNPEKARQLLAEAGYGKDKKLKTELWSSVGRYPMDTEISEAVQAQLMDVGIEVELIKKPDWGAFLFGLKKGSNRLGVTSTGPATGDADMALYMLYHSKEDINWSDYRNSEVDSLLEKARSTDNPKMRAEQYAKALETIFDEAPVAWLYYPKTIYGQRKNVKGVIFMPIEFVLFKNAYKE